MINKTSVDNHRSWLSASFKRFNRHICMCLGFLLLLTFSSGCGTLNRSISYDKLTQSDMAYARSLDCGRVNLNMALGPNSLSTSQTANKAVILPPLIYLRSLGVSESRYSKRYGYMRQFHLWPLCTAAKGSLYDSDGDVYARISGNVLSFVFGCMVVDDLKYNGRMSMTTLVPIPIVGGHLYSQAILKENGRTKAGRYEILRLPILGPCFAFGEGRKRFLWIPFGGG